VPSWAREFVSAKLLPVSQFQRFLWTGSKRAPNEEGCRSRRFGVHFALSDRMERRVPLIESIGLSTLSDARNAV